MIRNQIGRTMRVVLGGQLALSDKPAAIGVVPPDPASGLRRDAVQISAQFGCYSCGGGAGVLVS